MLHKTVSYCIILLLRRALLPIRSYRQDQYGHRNRLLYRSSAFSNKEQVRLRITKISRTNGWKVVPENVIVRTVVYMHNTRKVLCMNALASRLDDQVVVEILFSIAIMYYPKNWK